MLNVYINSTLISNNDIDKISGISEEKIQFNFSSLIASSISIDLNYNEFYDDEVENSLLYDNWYNKSLKIINTSLDNTVIWDGRIKNIKRNDAKRIITIESSNYIKDIIDAICVINTGIATDKTPAEIGLTP